jgi:hypothetical protein
MVFLYTQTFFSQIGGKTRAEPPSMGDVEESSRFIVAFELTEENGFNFIWPFESMRPSSYETVVVVVETMPRVRDDNNGGESELLIASRDLKFNGRRQKPSRIANRRAYFVVKLDQGRLRLSLSIPAGMSVDPENKTARIKLYQLLS